MMTLVLVGILINNARLNDTNARVEDAKELLPADVKSVREVLEAVMEKNTARCCIGLQAWTLA